MTHTTWDHREFQGSGKQNHGCHAGGMQMRGSVGDQGPRKNSGSHIDASHSRQPLVKGERLVRYEVNAVMHLQLSLAAHHKIKKMYMWVMSSWECCFPLLFFGIAVNTGSTNAWHGEVFILWKSPVPGGFWWSALIGGLGRGLLLWLDDFSPNCDPTYLPRNPPF